MAALRIIKNLNITIMKRKIFILSTLLSFIVILLTACINGNVPPEVPNTSMTQTRVNGSKTPIVALYLEVNDVDPRIAGTYRIGTEPFFNVVIIFAANIRADADGDPTLYFNDNITHIVSNIEKYIRPLQAMGIKVLLGILPDHQGIGLSNLTPDQAQLYAKILALGVSRYGFDGVDLDDEYANYGTHGFPNWNATSYSNLINALREEMPAGKMITVLEWLADTGGSTNISTTALENIDYAWYRYMGANSFGSSSISGMPTSKWSPQLLNLNTSYNFLTLLQIQNRSRQAKYGGYGAIATYDLRPYTERPGTLEVLQRIATGAEFGTVTKIENDYTKDWTSGGSTLTITKSDIQ